MGYPKRRHNFDNYPLKDPENPQKMEPFCEKPPILERLRRPCEAMSASAPNF